MSQQQSAPSVGQWQAFIATEEMAARPWAPSAFLAAALSDPSTGPYDQSAELTKALAQNKEQPLDFNFVGEGGRTLLMLILDMWARHNFHLQGVASQCKAQLLPLLSYYNANARDDKGQSTLHHFARIPFWVRGEPIVQLMTKLLAPSDLVTAFSDSPDQDGNTFLHALVWNQNAAFLEHVFAHHPYSAGLDFFHRNKAGETFVDMATRLAAPNAGRPAQTNALIANAFFKRWQSDIRPRLRQQITEEECISMSPDLIDIVLQYVDGHGRPFAVEAE